MRGETNRWSHLSSEGRAAAVGSLSAVHPVDRLKVLLDPARLAVAGALAGGPATSDTLIARTELDAVCRYSVEQHLSAARVSPEDLFPQSMLET